MCRVGIDNGIHQFSQEINSLAFTPEFQQRQQPLVENKTLLYASVAVIENLRQKSIQSLKCPHVMLEQQQRIHVILCILGSFAIVFLSFSCADL